MSFSLPTPPPELVELEPPLLLPQAARANVIANRRNEYAFIIDLRNKFQHIMKTFIFFLLTSRANRLTLLMRNVEVMKTCYTKVIS